MRLRCLALALLSLISLKAPAFGQTVPLAAAAEYEVTSFVGSASGLGSTDGIGSRARFSASSGIWGDEKNLYVADATNGAVRIFHRQSLEFLGAFGQLRHQGGQLDHVHNIAVDSRGNVYTGDVTGTKIQRWVYKGTS